MERVVSILCSGMGLGVYIPSLLLNYQLRQRGVKTEVFVIESYFNEEKLNKLKENKHAFHNSYQVAVFGHRMAKGDVRPNLDKYKIDELLKYWEENSRKDFIIMSGHWPVIFESYIGRGGNKGLNIDAVRMDTDVAPSWKNFNNNSNYFNEIWLFDNSLKNLPYRISVNKAAPIPFNQRENRFLLHGGGWGMGTYRDKLKELNEKGLYLDIVAYKKNEAEYSFEGNKYYLMEPDWSPWIKNSSGSYEFPPMYEVDRDGNLKALEAEGYQAIFDVCLNCKAIISKPGGGTLLDSLAAATPVVFIEPIAKHEQTNAALWEELGFGISYEKWAKQRFSLGILEKIHNNIFIKMRNTPDFIDDFLCRYDFLQNTLKEKVI